MSNRTAGYDVIRSFAIIVVFLAHSVRYQARNSVLDLILYSLSPGLTMSLLGFISGVLLTKKYGTIYASEYFIGRFTRIYSSLFVCLTVLSLYLTLLGKTVANRDSLLHFLGLSGFFSLFDVQSKSPLGTGMWFVTTIMAMYLLLPLLVIVLSHKNGFRHLFVIIVLFTWLDSVIYGSMSTWNVAIAFTIGSYVGLKGTHDWFERVSVFSIVLAVIVLTLSALATVDIIPRYQTHRMLFALYPIAFVPVFSRGFGSFSQVAVVVNYLFCWHKL